MSITVDGVTVRLGRDPEDFRRYLVTVQVYSQTRPGLKSTNDIDPGAANNQNHLLQLIGTAAAACAEYLDEKYGDNIDPVVCSRNALKAFREECHLQIAVAKGVPDKIKRLEQVSYVLKNNEKELLSKLRWSIDHGENLTPVEVDWLNKTIATHHSKQI